VRDAALSHSKRISYIIPQIRLSLRQRASASAMASQFRQLILDEYKPVVLVSASQAANSALERNNLSFDQIFAPHAEAALPFLPAGSVKEGSPFCKLDGTITVRFVDASTYTESEAEAEESLVKALTKHNNVSARMPCLSSASS
jgi:hypothetical protein